MTSTSPRDTRKMTEADRLCYTCPLPECNEYGRDCPWRIALGLPIRSFSREPIHPEVIKGICERHAAGVSYCELVKEYDLRYRIVWGIVNRGRD